MNWYITDRNVVKNYLITAHSERIISLMHISQLSFKNTKTILKTTVCSFYRAMHFSAKRGIAIACRLSVCPSVCLSVCDVGEL